MKHILLIATGGTIASGNSENGLTPQISSEELLSYVPAAREFCTIDAVQILNIDSTNLQPEHWLLMARTVRETMISTTALSSATAPIRWRTPPRRCPT